ncbi:hypothetical protein Tco_0563708 [Tanacetum coccineum]
MRQDSFKSETRMAGGCALHHWVHDVVFNVSNKLVILDMLGPAMKALIESVTNLSSSNLLCNGIPLITPRYLPLMKDIAVQFVSLTSSLQVFHQRTGYPSRSAFSSIRASGHVQRLNMLFSSNQNPLDTRVPRISKAVRGLSLIKYLLGGLEDSDADVVVKVVMMILNWEDDTGLGMRDR